MVKIVIVGGVAGGASAAARARRLDEHAEIILLQSGPDVSFASCGMPYFIGGEITDRATMAVQTPKSLHDKLNLDVRVNTRVTNIDTASKKVHASNEVTGENYEESYDHLILAVGAAPFKPPIPGIERDGLFALRNLQDMDAIVAWLDKKTKDVGGNPGDLHCVVAGAGFVGLEMVEQLLNRGTNVTLVEMLPQILGPLDVEMASYLENDLVKRGVDVITGDAIQEFKECKKDPDSSILTLKSGKVLPPAHLTILGLGVRPDTAIIKDAGIECTPRGHIQVNEYLQTSAPNVWAVGDAVEVNNPLLPGEKWPVPLAGPANRQGRMVADNIFSKGRDMRKYKGTYGTSVVRSFQLYAACVGLNEKMMQAKNLPYSCVHVHPGSHAGYFPGAKQVHLKLIFNPLDGKIYGAQAVGEDGVEKRIDVIATAIQGNMTVDDLAELELCYAPPVGSAKDVVNMAGMAAQNIVEGLVTQVEWNQLDTLANDKETVILDVRNAGEIQRMGTLASNAVNIPLDELRKRLDELDKGKHIVVSCASGQRAYYACRILRQHGFEQVDNLGGAFLTSHEVHPAAAGSSTS
ncbi:FAD-dependent pyridine nucleotide-disulfide oxidoreductase [Nitzschia inconspicua]|uniref:FAD-dependent pyridine nucleotide-disulfide oxidoreductase n=1 Tax=Nitzschia inconspicua TaxID=303405 RepID=A0A9K3LNS7_9STRA|nr:FAD-dependent pyridine nucleotide-disulfide oxidoreductase [Nitzschia inconspicua]